MQVDISEFPVKLRQALLTKDYNNLLKANKTKCLNDNLLGMIGCIPVVGAWLSAGIESGFSYSDAALFRKVFAFIYGIKDTSVEEREAFVREVETTANDVSGNVICDMINRLDNINKSEILANLMKARISGDIDIADFFRLSAVCERIPYPDLQHLKLFEDENYIGGGVTELLYSSGALLQRTIGENSNTYTLSASGRKLLKYGLLYDVNLNAKNATLIPSLGIEDIDNIIEQKRDDKDMFDYDVSRGK